MRKLPRFEVIQLGPRRYAAYDHLKKAVKFAPDARSFATTQMIVEGLEALARHNGEETTVLRADTPAVSIDGRRATNRAK